MKPTTDPLWLAKYDRSGRSTGTATITYETVDDAKKAKNLFDNKTARGALEMLVGNVEREC